MPKKTPGRWVKLAEDFHTNPKILALLHARRHRALNAYVCGLTWCAANHLDGWIPEFALPQLHATPTDAHHLEDVGLWQAAPGGWWVHDWSDWQDSSELRKQRTERMRAIANIRHHGTPKKERRTDA